MTEQYVTIECEWCDSTFEDSLGENYQTAKYCSTECRLRGNRSKYQANTVTCDQCGQEFERKPSHVREQNYCSQDCMGQARSSKYTGARNPNHKGKIVKECRYCGVDFKVKPSVKDDRWCCSKECHHNWMSENQCGENSPAWKGGYSGDYGYNWEKQRTKRLKDDNHQCVVCGTGDEEHKERHGCGLHVHHITRKESFRKNNGELDAERANRLENLISLCLNCHNRWEGIPVRPQ